jgi:hypothetical protein
MTDIRELDTGNPDHIALYERAFYDAFAPLTQNRLIRRLWEWDHAAKRLRTRVPYREQTIFATHTADGGLETVIALGTQLETIQSADYGFDVPRGATSCEALAVFGAGKRRLKETVQFGARCCELLRGRGFRTIYATCSPRVLPIYFWIGGEVLESREIEGETRHFFQISLDTPARRHTPVFHSADHE